MKKTKLFKTFLIAAFIAVSSGAFAQVKIGTNPTQIETGSNLEVEASGAGSHKVKVDKTSGQLTIKDGTEGLNKILISDAVGGASWQLPAAQNSDVMVSAWYRAPGNTYQALPFPNTTKLVFNMEQFDKGNNFDIATGQLTAPTSGYYNVHVGFSRGTPSPINANSIAGYLYVNNVDAGQGNLWDDNINAGEGYTVMASRLIHLNANDLLDIRLSPNFNSDGVRNAFFQIFKVSN